MEKAVVVNNKADQELIDLPPGFRFHPTDEEIITHYLKEKVMNTSFSSYAIGEADLNKSEPWDLPKKAKMGEKEFYFFYQRDRKYPTGMRTNRATAAGYWKATGKDKEIYNKGKSWLVGMKKTLVFYKGRAPKGEKTNWVMHEFRLEGKFSYYNLPKGAKDEWVVSRVFHKSIGAGMKKNPIQGLQMNHSFGDDVDFFDNYASLPPLMDPQASFPINGAQNELFKPINTTTQSTTISYNQNSFNHPQNQLFSSYQNNPINPEDYLQQAIRSTGAISSVLTGTAFAAKDDQAAIVRALATSHHHHHHNNLDNISQQIKVEQFVSNHSMISRSQDTGVSADINTTTEISSIEADEGHLDDTSIPELDTFWDY